MQDAVNAGISRGHSEASITKANPHPTWPGLSWPGLGWANRQSVQHADGPTGQLANRLTGFVANIYIINITYQWQQQEEQARPVPTTCPWPAPSPSHCSAFLSPAYARNVNQTADRAEKASQISVISDTHTHTLTHRRTIAYGTAAKTCIKGGNQVRISA